MQPSAPRSLALGASALTVLAVATVAGTPGSPFHPVLPAAAQPAGPFRWLSDALGLGTLSPGVLAAVSVVSVALAAAAFVFVLLETWRRRISVRAVVVLAIAAHLVVALLPLLFSRDVYSYAYYGKIASVYGANPYVATPAEYPGDVLTHYVGPKWVDTPAVYGPLWVLVSSWVVRAFANVTATIAAFRMLALAASLGTLAVIATLVRRLRPEREAFALAAFGLNPVVLFQSVGSGHNDLWVGLSIASALALLLARRPLLATGVLTLGALVKVTAGLPLLLLVVAAVARAEPRRRAATAVAHVGVAAGVALAFAFPFLQTKDPTLGLVELASHEGWLAPSRLFRRLLDAVSLGWLARAAFAIALLVALGTLLARVARPSDRTTVEEEGATWGWALLFLMLLGPVLLPWYVAWALPLVWLLPRVPRLVLAGLSVSLVVSQFTVEPARFAAAYDANLLVGHYVITPLVVALLGWLALDLRRRAHADAPLADEPGGVPAEGRER